MKQRITNLYRTHRFGCSVAVAVFIFVFGSMSLVVVNGETLEPNDSHVVSLYVDGVEYNVPTRARTVSELIERSKIQIGEHDSVEPGLETKIESNQFKVRIIRARAYVVVDGDKEHSALSAHTTARLIAEAAGLELKPADKVEFADIGDMPLTEIGRVVEIQRSKQVAVGIYGSLQVVNTNVSSVGELMLELGIYPAPDDTVSAIPETQIVEGLTFTINRKGISTVTDEVSIPAPLEYVEDLDLSLGSITVRDPGKVGKRVVTYEFVTENGVEVSRKEISSVIVEQPQKKIVARGRAFSVPNNRQELMALAGIPESDYGFADYVIGREGSWCATKWQGQWGICPAFYEEKFPGAESDTKTGYGICQSTPANKMASAGEDWRINVVTQLKWCTNYANSRYGGWEGAYNAWVGRLERDGHGWW